MARELMPKSGIMMPHVVVTRDAAVVGVSTVDGQAGAIDLTGKYLQKTDAAATYQTKTEGASKDFVLDSIQPIMSGALFREDPWVVNDTPFRSTGANGVESVDMMKVTPDNSIKIGSYASSVQGVEIHSAGRLQVVDQNDSGVETKYPVYSKRYRPEIEDLPFAAIGSYVKDSKGRTIGVNRTGINSDIKQLTQKVTFTQPVTVPDAVGDYDAVTLRQLRNSGGGSGGPTMSGISNFGIGDFHLRDSRAFIPAFEVVSDGQLLNRADYPDLWAYAQLLSPIEDSEWVSNVYQRGKYSKGNGTTTFRVPDRNGVQSGSIQGLFGRGDAGSSGSNGVVSDSGAPNITYSSPHTMVTLASASGQVATNGAIQSITSTDDVAPVGTGGKYISTNFDASRSSAVYGRSLSEVVPRNFIGVWTIRAHGGFTAANTSWSVINSDASEQPTGTPITGGLVSSKYVVGGVDKYRSSIQLLGSNEVDLSTRITTINDRYAIGAATWDFKLDGKLLFNKSLTPKGTGESPGNTYLTLANTWMSAAYSGYIGFVGGGVGVSNGGWRNFISLGSLIFPDSSHPTAVISQVYDYDLSTGSQPNGDIVRNTYFSAESYDITFGNNSGTTNYIFSKSPVSDERLKHSIKEEGTATALSNLNKMEYKTFIYNYDEKATVRRGFIAQQLEAIDPQYVRKYKTFKGTDTLALDENVLLLDAIAAIQELTKKVEVLEAKLAEK
ncbi:tail fiber protein [Escherichia phage phiEco32]|uniref:Probable tail fiber protein n=1 Tax=Escherichia phage Phieco32 TaxID=2679905 RepID=FIB11_BPE32|nr:tail fiber protein [Escherichia phage phiEco32]B0FIH7.1 RecName: Full=Probable tail fiber protein; AltName: Full=Gene product 11; Short=gp11 [Escherichia phage phiEco32]ABY52816.1 tail fiber [Escherichia phage phiEco32]